MMKWQTLRTWLSPILGGSIAIGALAFTVLRPTSVTVGTVTRRTLEPVVQGVGTVEAKVVVQVAAKITGRIVSIAVDQGDSVEQGQIVVRLDDSQQRAEVSRDEASVGTADAQLRDLLAGSRPEEIAEARANVARAEAQLNDVLAGSRQPEIEELRERVNSAVATRTLAERDLRRQKELFTRELVAAQDVDRAQQALAVRAKTLALNARQDRPHPSIDVNIGINTGTCDVGSTRLHGIGGDRWTYTATGAATNLGAWLCAEARHGQILIGPETARRVTEAIALRSLGRRELKNLAAPVEVWEVAVEERTMRAKASLAVTAMLLTALVPSAAFAGPPTISVGHQPMVSTGLAARHPFEAWFVLDKSVDPAIPGYAIPAGATIRFVFPESFTPRDGAPLGAVMLYGWPQRAIPVKFTVRVDPSNPRAIVIHFDEAISADPPERPGLKAIHLRTGKVNPSSAGEQPITVEFADAGALSGATTAVAHITETPVPNIAAYNQLHEGRNEDWQHVSAGADAPIPIDFLVTLPDVARSSIGLRPMNDGRLSILSDGVPVGVVETRGVPIRITPEVFGPGFARLGIIRIHVKAGMIRGAAEIIARLDGGTQYTINLMIE